MAGKLLPDDLWDKIADRFPEYEPSPQGGRPPASDRDALTVILFVLKTGIGWKDVPQELGCSGRTAQRRLAEWNAIGLWDDLHSIFLAELRGADAIDWSRALLDSGTVKAPLGGENAGRTRPIEAGREASITC